MFDIFRRNKVIYNVDGYIFNDRGIVTYLDFYRYIGIDLDMGDNIFNNVYMNKKLCERVYRFIWENRCLYDKGLINDRGAKDKFCLEAMMFGPGIDDGCNDNELYILRKGHRRYISGYVGGKFYLYL